MSNGVLEAINGNVQAAKRKAKGYRTKRNLKAIVTSSLVTCWLIHPFEIARSPITVLNASGLPYILTEVLNLAKPQSVLNW